MKKWNRRTRVVVLSGGLSLLFLAIYIAGVMLPEELTEPSIRSTRLPPSLEHFFGTDALGRDLFFRRRDPLFLGGFFSGFVRCGIFGQMNVRIRLYRVLLHHIQTVIAKYLILRRFLAAFHAGHLSQPPSFLIEYIVHHFCAFVKGEMKYFAIMRLQSIYKWS